jgi:peptide deformylase
MTFNLRDMPKGIKLCQVLTGDKVKRKCSEVANVEPEILTATIWRMIRACVSDDGVGLAAPQIGVFKRLFVMKVAEDSFRVCVNPSYAPAPGATRESGVEGCLSVPGKRVAVKRFTAINACWIELSHTGVLEHRTELLDGFDARVFQHEYDHLLGIIILDRSR